MVVVVVVVLLLFQNDLFLLLPLPILGLSASSGRPHLSCRGGRWTGGAVDVDGSILVNSSGSSSSPSTIRASGCGLAIAAAAAAALLVLTPATGAALLLCCREPVLVAALVAAAAGDVDTSLDSVVGVVGAALPLVPSWCCSSSSLALADGDAVGFLVLAGFFPRPTSAFCFLLLSLDSCT